MLIAIPTEDQQVAAHFGRCPHYTLLRLENGTLQEQQIIENPGHTPGFLPRYLTNLGVDVLITGGIGNRALQLFSHQKIRVVSGASGPIDAVLDSFLSGHLTEDTNLCDHPDTPPCDERG